MPAPERFGALSFPVAGTEPVGDPALSVVLAFAEAILNTRMSAAWQTLGRPAGDRPVRKVFAHNPEETSFNDAALPALFAWREEGQTERIAADYVLERGALQLCWVFPATIQPTSKARGSIVNAVAKLLVQGLMRGRDPAWVAAGDTSPRATLDGSLVWKFAGLWRCGPPRWRLQPVQIDSGEERERWRALRLEIPIEERLVDQPAPVLAGLELSLQTPGPDPLVTNTLALDPAP